jgi:hypothetical protein
VSPKLLGLEPYVEECKQEDNAQVTIPISLGIECRAKEVLSQYTQVRKNLGVDLQGGLQLLSRRNSHLKQALSKPQGIKALLE